VRRVLHLCAARDVERDTGRAVRRVAGQEEF